MPRLRWETIEEFGAEELNYFICVMWKEEQEAMPIVHIRADDGFKTKSGF